MTEAAADLIQDLYSAWFIDNGTSGCNISFEADKDGKKVWGASTGESTTSNLLSKEKPKGPLTHDQRAPYSRKTKTGASDLLSSLSAVRYPDGIFTQSKNVWELELNIGSRNQDLYRSSEEVSDFQIADEADHKLEYNLPDVDSFITIDDTYILKQEQPAKAFEFSCRGVKSISPFPGLNKSRGSEIIQQNSSSPDPRLYESQLNSWNRSDSKVHVNSPSRYYDPCEYPFAECSSLVLILLQANVQPNDSSRDGQHVPEAKKEQRSHVDYFSKTKDAPCWRRSTFFLAISFCRPAPDGHRSLECERKNF